MGDLRDFTIHDTSNETGISAAKFIVPYYWVTIKPSLLTVAYVPLRISILFCIEFLACVLRMMYFRYTFKRILQNKWHIRHDSPC
jgi:hypothetical protein